MPREWTDEQREEARQRAKKHNFGRKAAVTQGPSAEALLLAQAQAKPSVVTTENITEDKEDGNVTHTKPGLVRVYKPTAYGYKARYIPATNVPMALSNGFLARCPDCGGECGDGPNDCPNRPKRMYRTCPVPQCGKKIFDYEPKEIEALENDADPMAIRDDSYMQSTPELRTKAVLDKHMLMRHPNEAAAAGILAPAQREVQRGLRAV
jgi:hypothetical protein